jgi:predicted RNase H-like HicB family nuclease
MGYRIEVERENDGRWLAEVVDAPVDGILAYGKTREQAKAAAIARLERVLAERPEPSEDAPEQAPPARHVAK